MEKEIDNEMEAARSSMLHLPVRTVGRVPWLGVSDAD